MIWDLMRHNCSACVQKTQVHVHFLEETNSWNKDPPPAGSKNPRDLGPGQRTTSPQRDQGPCLLFPGRVFSVTMLLATPQSAGTSVPASVAVRASCPQAAASVPCPQQPSFPQVIFQNFSRIHYFLVPSSSRASHCSKAKSNFLTRVP